jgi:hypothetical protein
LTLSLERGLSDLAGAGNEGHPLTEEFIVERALEEVGAQVPPGSFVHGKIYYATNPAMAGSTPW